MSDSIIEAILTTEKSLMKRGLYPEKVFMSPKMFSKMCIEKPELIKERVLEVGGYSLEVIIDYEIENDRVYVKGNAHLTDLY